LREGPTIILSKLSNTGKPVIIDISEGEHIRSRNDQSVDACLVRWARVRGYGLPKDFWSSANEVMATRRERVVLKFDHVERGLSTCDATQPQGFLAVQPAVAICLGRG
jgi:sialate O-acetylesterase